ncbi:MAG: PEGA domain-containing protein, partial [Gemmatimonadaceae bacterium]|nr:PEGA domain-containing protein [Gemmatimonadaceae bacterium]
SSKMGLYIGIALLVIGGGGAGVWMMNGKQSDATPSAVVNPTPSASPNAPATDASAPTTTPGATVDAAALAKALEDSIAKLEAAQRLEAEAAKAAAKPATKVAGANEKKSAPPRTTPTRTPDPKPVTPTQSAPVQNTPAPQAPAADAKAKLRIALNTAADDIQIDGESVGPNTRVEREVIGGAHRIVVRKEGFITIDTTVTIDAGKTELFRFTLQPRQP